MFGGRNGVAVEGVCKSYHTVTALRDITFDVGWGEVVALLGPNGAGKSTAVGILATLIRPDSGRALVAGYDVVTEAAMVRRSITLTGQSVSIDELLTGQENLVMFGRLRGLTKSVAQDRARELLAEFGLKDAADRRVGTYSGGMRRRIDVACGLVVRPRVAFMDEPTTGLDPRSRQTIWGLIDTFKEAGVATLLTTQNLGEADTLCDRIVVLDGGSIVAQGSGNDLKERIGGTLCEFVPKNPVDVAAIADAVGPLLSDTTVITLHADRVTMPAPDGLGTLAAAFARLNAADIELADMALRRPSLDDVFLALTGKTAGDNDFQPETALGAGS